jgi:hypothetical protein
LQQHPTDSAVSLLIRRLMRASRAQHACCGFLILRILSSES